MFADQTLHKVITTRLKQAMLIAAGALLAGPVLAATPSAPGASAYFITPQNGDVVSSPVTVRFGLKGMGVAPAGVEKANTGHHHLLVDSDALPPMGKPMGNEVTHFGGGQTETVLELEPGEHTLQLILGDHFHVPHDPAVVSEKITITVK